MADLKKTLLSIQQMCFQLLQDGRCDFVLDGEDVGQFPVVGVRPEMEAVFHLNQLRGDPHLRARLAHRAFQDVLHAQGFTDLSQIQVLPLERKRGSAAGNFQFFHPRQGIQNLFRNAIGKIFLLGIRGHVDER